MLRNPLNIVKDVDIKLKDSSLSSHAVLQPTVDCDSLIDRFIHSSTYKIDFESKDTIEYRSVVNAVKDSIITIEIRYMCMFKNQPNQFAIGWVDLNLKDGTLVDITKDINEPVKLSYDEKMLDSVKKNCVFTNSDD
ncbi:hypothetical protein GA0116948_1352 [Chitinophaga costaii]|uniref:Uncharacterized protein n=1 Tax=Chitinophaga costaii TaxID=1335309 RepID=A0A1C4G8W4_9BACT|nr:hypothetical protein [Chitinophaga costaii]PUZ19712.1 hypothetical protein DCM91_20310 [Chitinophaga costaii]SCC64612.1 hypothetical protein GA0116948_1352 [Chitinophaga costaii]